MTWMCLRPGQSIQARATTAERYVSKCNLRFCIGISPPSHAHKKELGTPCPEINMPQSTAQEFWHHSKNGLVAHLSAEALRQPKHESAKHAQKSKCRKMPHTSIWHHSTNRLVAHLSVGPTHQSAHHAYKSKWRKMPRTGSGTKERHCRMLFCYADLTTNTSHKSVHMSATAANGVWHHSTAL